MAARLKWLKKNFMTLTEQLSSYSQQSATRIPEPAQKIMKDAIKELENSTIAQRAFKKGQQLPHISLPNASGKTVNIQEELKNNKVVLTFYRGGWCPYCNLELKALQAKQAEIEAKGAKLIAISPEAPDNSLSTTQKNALTFDILTDANNEVARSLGLVYELPQNLVSLYKQFGINLEQSQGMQSNELPIAATYIINQEGSIDYDFIEEDYKLRAEPAEVVAAL
jgi:peroxiredoxin